MKENAKGMGRRRGNIGYVDASFLACAWEKVGGLLLALLWNKGSSGGVSASLLSPVLGFVTRRNKGTSILVEGFMTIYHLIL